MNRDIGHATCPQCGDDSPLYEAQSLDGRFRTLCVPCGEAWELQETKGEDVSGISGATLAPSRQLTPKERGHLENSWCMRKMRERIGVTAAPDWSDAPALKKDDAA